MSRGGLVWSSDSGRMCPACKQPSESCRCTRSGNARSRPDDGIVRVSRETKGRRGKGVTVVTGLPGTDAEIAKLAKALKRRCGSGGTAKDGVIEIQGEHRDTLVAELEKRGFTAKRVGG